MIPVRARALVRPRAFLGAVVTAAMLITGCGGPASTPETTASPLTAADLIYRAGAAYDTASPLERIAFGSCSRVDLPQPLWSPINAADPDLWVWLGDNIYADEDFLSVARGMYEAQLAMPEYAHLLQTTPVIGTWDDHDYGANDAGKENPLRVQSQVELLDFLGEPQGSERRRQEGVYASYTYGEAPNRTKVILLDTRYHRDAPGPEADILGEAQWTWLEAQLRDTDAQLNLIGGGFQFLAEDHRFEKWANFPVARARLLHLIGNSGAAGVILLSGDRHISEIARVDDPALSYPLYEVTSSGMTHSWADNPGELNRYRVGELYTQLSFGMLEVDWAAGTVSLQLRAQDGTIAVEEVVELETLGGG